jgi:hypothetical protein
MKNKVILNPKTWIRQQSSAHGRVMTDYLLYNTQYQVLICKEHQCGIQNKWITRHFREEHPGLSLQTRQEIFNYSSQFSVVDSEALTYSEGSVPAIIGLKVADGFRCDYDQCKVILGTEHSIKWHCNRVHAWKGMDQVKWTGIHVQTIYSGNNRRSFSHYLY